MAIINCPECSKDISEKSKTCIHCGYPIEGKKTINVNTSFNKFSIIFILAMLPTYLLRGAYFYSSFALIDINIINANGDAMNLLMAVCYVIMISVTYSRAKSLSKGYITVLPILSAIFDMILLFIPLVPTILNVITILLLRPVDNEVNQEVDTTFIILEKSDKWDEL
jgi:hypothetical protein